MKNMGSNREVQDYVHGLFRSLSQHRNRVFGHHHGVHQALSQRHGHASSAALLEERTLGQSIAENPP